MKKRLVDALVIVGAVCTVATFSYPIWFELLDLFWWLKD